MHRSVGVLVVRLFMLLMITPAYGHTRHHHHEHHHVHSISTKGLPKPLVKKLDDIKCKCHGFRVVSTFRPHAKVAGTHRTSLHAYHKAADFFVSSWSCAYSLLRGWPGGVSTDAWRVKHIHISWAPGGREWGSRFVHHHVSAYGG